MLLIRMSWMIGGLFMFAGCQTLTAQPDIPALITNPTEESRAALKIVLAEVFHRKEVTLADNALTETSLLTIESGARHIIGKLSRRGRILEKPIQFRLVKNGNECVLINLRDQSRQKLQNTTCAPQ